MDAAMGGASELPGIGGSLALSFVSLGLVCLAAYVALRWLARRGVGTGSGPIKLLARCPLEPRRSLYLVEAAGRCFLIGAGEGAMSLVAEVDPAQIERKPAGAPTPIRDTRFGEVLARVLRRPSEGRTDDTTAGASERRGAGPVSASVLALAAAAGAGADRAGSVTSRPLVLIFAMAALSLLPFVLLLMTSFVRIAVVLSILKSAIGTPQVPPTQVVTGLALILTLYVMAPTGERMYRAVEPVLGRAAGADLMSGETVGALSAALDRAKEPMRDFLLKHSAVRDRTLFHGLALRMRAPEERAQISDKDFLVVVPAFLTSELRRAFEIGFLLFIPFLVVDMVIANLLLALGMHMLSPTTVSLPFKLLLFVVADGWQIVIRGLVESYV